MCYIILNKRAKNCRMDITINILELNYFARESISQSFNHINVSKSLDTYLVITNNNSLYAVTQPQHISIQIQLYTQYIQYIQNTNSTGVNSTTRCTKTWQQCVIPPLAHCPGCWQPPRTSQSRTMANRRAVLRSPAILQRITAGTLSTTCLPQWRLTSMHSFVLLCPMRAPGL